MTSAERALRERLRRNPHDFGAAIDLAHLLYTTGAADEAFALYRSIVERHPGRPAAHTNFAFLLVRAGELERARAHYERALALEPANEQARRGLLVVATQLGDREGIAALGTGQHIESTVVSSYRGDGTPVDVLVPITLGAGNVPTDMLFDDRIFRTTKLAVELFETARALPSHDVAFNAVGDADTAAAALREVGRLFDRSPMPVLNRPERVRRTGRVENAARLSAIEGVRVPAVAPFERATLDVRTLAAAGFGFPLLLRAPGYHTGRHFLGVNEPGELARALAALPGEEVLAIEYVDTRDSAGNYRKYRAMFVEGRVYPLHLAVASHWKVHYLSSDMAERADHRALEAGYLGDMIAAIGERAVSALQHVAQMLGLEYAGADFAFDAQGRLVVFEANATMAVLPVPPEECWEYRRAPVERVLDAVRRMLAAHPSRGRRRSN